MQSTRTLINRIEAILSRVEEENKPLKSIECVKDFLTVAATDEAMLLAICASERINISIEHVDSITLAWLFITQGKHEKLLLSLFLKLTDEKRAEVLKAITHLDHSATERAAYYTQKFAERNRDEVKQDAKDQGVLEVQIDGELYPVVTRKTRNFSEKPLISTSSTSLYSDRSELIKLNPNDPILTAAYRRFKEKIDKLNAKAKKKDFDQKTLQEGLSPEEILTLLFGFTADIFKNTSFTEFDAFLQKKIKEQGGAKKNTIDLSFFVKEKQGVCRHHALFNAYILSKLKDDKLISGDIIHHSQQVKIASSDGGHSWVFFKDKQGKLYCLDSLHRESLKFLALDKNNNGAALDKYYGGPVYKFIEKHYANKKDPENVLLSYETEIFRNLRSQLDSIEPLSGKIEKALAFEVKIKALPICTSLMTMSLLSLVLPPLDSAIVSGPQRKAALSLLSVDNIYINHINENVDQYQTQLQKLTDLYPDLTNIIIKRIPNIKNQDVLLKSAYDKNFAKAQGVYAETKDSKIDESVVACVRRATDRIKHPRFFHKAVDNGNQDKYKKIINILAGIDLTVGLPIVINFDDIKSIIENHPFITHGWSRLDNGKYVPHRVKAIYDTINKQNYKPELKVQDIIMFAAEALNRPGCWQETSTRVFYEKIIEYIVSKNEAILDPYKPNIETKEIKL